MSRRATWLRQLHQNGYRLTDSRRAVVAAMAAAEHALTPADVHALAGRQHPPLGLTTVYRTLETLAEMGLIERVHGPEGCHAYVPAASGHQHLLVCEQCGRSVHFAGDQLGALMKRVAAESGFVIRDHWLQFFGLCANCQDDPVAE
jgi:Fe2+ or Zn2+ uptake regulation protein